MSETQRPKNRRIGSGVHLWLCQKGWYLSSTLSDLFQPFSRCPGYGILFKTVCWKREIPVGSNRKCRSSLPKRVTVSCSPTIIMDFWLWARWWSSLRGLHISTRPSSGEFVILFCVEDDSYCAKCYIAHLDSRVFAVIISVIVVQLFRSRLLWLFDGILLRLFLV